MPTHPPTPDSRAQQIIALRKALERASHAVQVAETVASKAQMDLYGEKANCARVSSEFEHLRETLDQAMEENKRLRSVLAELVRERERDRQPLDGMEDLDSIGAA